MIHDVVILGGGPAGSTCASLLKKYAPDKSVLVLEREVFPREHVGESQLPPITSILEEMGCWEKCEAAGFPIKTGAMYRWGNSPDLWKLDFLVGEQFEELPRPSPLAGQRLQTTFHVERSVYDTILLNHAQSLGAEVRQGVRVKEVDRQDDQINGLTLEDGSSITGRYYVDATGHAGFLRRQMGVGIDEPTSLKNIAIWDYWENPAWAETVCRGGVRARIFSIGYGWIWFIPLSTTRVSVGLVTHADYYKNQGLRPQELYEKALGDEPFLKAIWPGAVSEGKLQSTKDWSFTAQRLVGQNWYLVGESAGFADPILAAGMTLAQVGAKELAYTLKALLNGEHEASWLNSWYEELSLRRVRQHIRFADFWYSANGHFTDLKAYTQQIAADNGLTLKPDEAFRWLSTGGFATDSLQSAAFGTYQLGPAKAVLQVLTGDEVTWGINNSNEWKLNLAGAQKVEVPIYSDGKITQITCYQRDARILPFNGYYRIIINALNQTKDATTVMALVRDALGVPRAFRGYYGPLIQCLEAIEGMLGEGWLKGSMNKKRPMVKIDFQQGTIRLGADDVELALLETTAQ